MSFHTNFGKHCRKNCVMHIHPLPCTGFEWTQVIYSIRHVQVKNKLWYILCTIVMLSSIILITMSKLHWLYLHYDRSFSMVIHTTLIKLSAASTLQTSIYFHCGQITHVYNLLNLFHGYYLGYTLGTGNVINCLTQSRVLLFPRRVIPPEY